MRFDRQKFFDGIKDLIDPSLSQEQVDGLEFLLKGFETRAEWQDIRHIAYALATVFHETAGSFQPVEEGYYLGSKAKAFQKRLRYYPYFGRGYVQLTWKTNYEKAGEACGVNLVKEPDRAKDPDIAFLVLTLGLFRGWFGAKITTHINKTKTDYINARRCVNILDKAGMIAGYAKSFEKVLNSAATVTNPAKREPTIVNTENSPTILSEPPPIPEPTPQNPLGLNQPENPTTNVETKIVEKIEDVPPGTTTETTTTINTNDSVGVKPAKPSIWTSIVAFGTMLYGYFKVAKEDFGAVIDRATGAIDIHFLLNAAVGAGLVLLGIYLYDRSRQRAVSVTKDLIATAADPSQNTVHITK